MRHSAVTFAAQVEGILKDSGDHDSLDATPPWDALICTDMLGLAEFNGLCPRPVRGLPSIIYFHENQLTYPNQTHEPRDLHFAYSNLTSALAADAVWFNSAFHRDEFLSALKDWLARMPDFGHPDVVETIRGKSSIQSPGIDVPNVPITTSRIERTKTQPIRIAWASRWEHDKNPEMFFAALAILADSNVPFELNVLGESFRNSPECFETGRHRFAEKIHHWGYAKDRTEYFRILSESDVVVSTASHEFFGISILEAVAAGCFPVVPRKLAYPETLGLESDCFYDGTAGGLAEELALMAARFTEAERSFDTTVLRKRIHRYLWPERSACLDSAVNGIGTMRMDSRVLNKEA